METTVQRLRYVLEVLAPAVGSKTLPILNNVVIGQGRAHATNLETAVSVEYPEAIDDPLLLPHRQLLGQLRHIPGPTRLSVKREGQAIKLAMGATRAELPVSGEVKDFPPLASIQPMGEGQVDGDLFLKTATALALYAATAHDRPVLECVCIELGAPLTLIAADGFRLAWMTIPMALPALNSPATDLKHLLLPATTVATLAKVWKVMEKVPSETGQGGADPLKQDGGFRMAMSAVAKRMADIRFTPRLLSFRHGAVTIRVALTEGEFPNYHQLIPTDLSHKVTFDAEDALRAIKSLAQVAADGSGILRLQWAGDRLMLSATAEQAGTMATSVRAHIQGEESRIAFNIRYLLEYLQGKLGMVLLETATPSSSGRFYHGGSPDVLVMPLFVSDPATPTAEPTAAQPADEEASEEPPDDQKAPVNEGNHEGPEATASPPTRSKKPRRGK